MAQAETNLFTENAYEKVLNEAAPVVLAFWADWNPPSKQMLNVVDELAKEHSTVKFVKVEAEKFPDITKNYPVKAVPTFVVVRAGKVENVIEGANPPVLVAQVSALAQRAAAAPVPAVPSPSPAAPAESPEELNARLSRLVAAASVMVFIKGSPDAPRCGFSRQIIELLREVKATFGFFDILTDDSVRQGLKNFSNWPTFPQLYINGKFIGGLDVAKELHSEGELAAMIPQKAEVGSSALNNRLKDLVNQRHVMLFMKGTPDAPKCGFSNKMVALLREAGAEDFGSFDILEDQSVREGLKVYSNWPTFPQLYVDGKLIGGLDVATEMHSEGELAPLLKGE